MFEITVVLGIIVSGIAFYFGLQEGIDVLFGAGFLLGAVTFLAAVRGGWIKKQPLPAAREAEPDKVTGAGVPEADALSVFVGFAIIGAAVLFFFGLQEKIDWMFGVGFVALAWATFAGVRGKILR